MTASPVPSALATDQVQDLLHRLTVIDVRTPGEYASGHLPGALNIPLDQLRRALPDIRHAAERDVLVVCASGARSQNACALLAEQGIPAERRPRRAARSWCGARKASASPSRPVITRALA